MGAQGSGNREWRRIELQLDTAQIILVFAMLLGLCASSFYLGRWIERDRWSGSGSKGAGGSGKLAESAAGADLTFFDTLGGKQGNKPEPGRQARPARPAGETPAVPAAGDAAEGPLEAGGASPPPAAAPSGTPPPKAAPSPALPSGAFAVQVFSGDRAQAEKIVSSLSRKGYAARAVPLSAGSSSVRVRLYGYKTKADATKAADRVRREDHLAPWVVKAD